MTLSQDATSVPVIEAKIEPVFAAGVGPGSSPAVKLRILVSPAGDRIGCELIYPDGPARDAETACAQLLGSTRFSPATDESGAAIAGITHVWAQKLRGAWRLSNPPDWDPVNFSAEVNKMPAGFQEMTTFHLSMLVDETGHPQHCHVIEEMKEKTRDFLCREAANVSFPPAKDRTGHVMTAVQPFTMRFVSKGFMDRFMQQHFPDAR